MTVPGVQIIEVLLKDLPQLQEISRRTFHESFADANSRENMQIFLDHHFSREKLTSEILNPESQFFFAVSGGRNIGYLKINRGGAQTVLPNNGALEIERIYIDSKEKGNGIGRMLIEKSVELARATHAKYIWLGVWEKNTAAIRFYERNGFQIYDNHLFLVGEDPQTDFLMKKTL